MLEGVILISIALILIIFGIIIYWYWHPGWSAWVILLGIIILMGIIVAMVLRYQ